MIILDRVAVRYQDAATPVFTDVNLRIGDGELVLVTGPTGSGKSTLLGLLNGLVPHFTGGTLTGTVEVDGMRTDRNPPRDFAAIVGVVGQDPLAGFVTDTVEEELAYGMEQLGVAPGVMRQRVEQTLDLMGIAELRWRSLRTLSGGQQQRVAIGAVLAAGPRVLVLDEPTSALDPTSAEEVVAAVVRLVHDLGVTVVLSEHRLERVLQYADRVVFIDGAGGVVDGDPVQMMEVSPIAPPVVELGRLAGWRPLPLSVRDARRAGADLRTVLADPVPPPLVQRREVLAAQRVCVSHQGVPAVHDVSVRLGAGERAVLMGRNGSGKSSLLWALSGAGTRNAGDVAIDGEQPRAGRADLVGLVPQSPADLLYLATVADECVAADRRAGRDPGSCRALLDRLVPGVLGERHPRDLSEGQRLGLVLAAQLTGHPRVLLLDEPTRGLDYPAKARLTASLAELADAGTALLVATHDVEFAAGFADRVLVLAQGELIADGPAAELLCGSPALAPQVARVLHPLHYLTVDELRPFAEVTGD